MTNHIKNPIQYSAQEILNESFNDSYKVLTVANYVFDGSAFVPQSKAAAAFATMLDDFTTPKVTYVGLAAPGSAVGAAVWQIQKLDETTGAVVTWADGNANFDNVWGTAGAVASLSYS